MKRKEVIQYLEEQFGTCEPPYEWDCIGCVATKLRLGLEAIEEWENNPPSEDSSVT